MEDVRFASILSRWWCKQAQSRVYLQYITNEIAQRLLKGLLSLSKHEQTNFSMCHSNCYEIDKQYWLLVFRHFCVFKTIVVQHEKAVGFAALNNCAFETSILSGALLPLCGGPYFTQRATAPCILKDAVLLLPLLWIFSRNTCNALKALPQWSII